MRRCGALTTRSAVTQGATERSSASCSAAESTLRRVSSRRCSSPSRTETRRSSARSKPLPTSTAEIWDTIAAEAGRESPLWTAALKLPEEQEREPVFSPLAEPRYTLGIETIYEGYLLHYGHSRLFAPRDGDTALLLGDYLYAHGLVRVERVGTVDAVNDLAELIALCAYLQAEVITGMLIVGLVFVGVIALGETLHWVRHRRRARTRV